MEQTMKLTTNKLSEDISKALDKRLNELSQATTQMGNAIQTSQNNMTSSLSQILGEIRDRVQNLGGSRSSSYY